MRTSATSTRYVEVDLLRTLAIVMMIVYHIAYDLQEFYAWDINVFVGGWKLLQIATASLFLFLVGVSFILSNKRRNEETKKRNHIPRAIQILAAALVVTIVTYFFDPETYVRFGILHMIGVSILLLPFFVRFKEWNVLLGSILIFIGITIDALYSIIPITIYRNVLASAILTIFNLPSPYFATLDYYPLIPWFGIVLLGMGIGHFIYIRNKVFRETFELPDSRFQLLTWPGKHALLIYLIHQPIILIVLAATGYMVTWLHG